MKNKTTYASASAARYVRKRRARIAKHLAIAGALIAICAFVTKEMVINSLKELRNSLATAETEFRTENGQSTLSLQIMEAKQQIELFQRQSNPSKIDPHRDYSNEIAQATQDAWQIKANLDGTFDDVSRLIDAMPSGAASLRQTRDKLRADVQKSDQDVDGVLRPVPDKDLGRLLRIKLLAVQTLVDEIPVLTLGDTALTSAERIKKAADILIRFCTRAFYVFGLLSLVLGFFSAITGINAREA